MQHKFVLWLFCCSAVPVMLKVCGNTRPLSLCLRRLKAGNAVGGLCHYIWQACRAQLITVCGGVALEACSWGQ